MKARRPRKWLQVVLASAFLLLIATVSIAANKRDAKRLCTGVDVTIKDADKWQFVTDTMVADWVTRELEEGWIHRPMASIPLHRLEQKMQSRPFVATAQLFPTPKGEGASLHVVIEQKKPQYRIINNEGVSYYIAENGTRMPLSDTFTPRLIVAVGNIPFVDSVHLDSTAMRLDRVVRAIQNDAWLSALFGQVYVSPSGAFELLPRWHHHRVLLGEGKHIVPHLEKLKLFYKKAYLHTNWSAYKTIDLRFKDQVVCAKNESI